MKFIAIFLLTIIAATGFIYLSQRPISSNTSTTEFVVNQGDGVVTIASRLEKNNFIRNKFVFILFAYKMGLNTRLQAGTFRLSPTLSTSQIIAKLSKAGSNDYWLKIIDGQRVEEITPRFDTANEGYLFPDSYLIPQDFTNTEILALIKKHFDEKFAQAKISATSKLTDPEIVTLASLLEREGRTLETKQKIAGVLMNRLDIGMALQLDATVQYARDKFKKVYWLPVSKSDLSIKSPYNTYLNPGLPPAPICNPGYNSLYAAFHPISSDYLYYITDNSGNIHFAKTLDEHNSNVAKYLR
jgi:UPF0755 protein